MPGAMPPIGLQWSRCMNHFWAAEALISASLRVLTKDWRADAPFGSIARGDGRGYGANCTDSGDRSDRADVRKMLLGVSDGMGDGGESADGDSCSASCDDVSLDATTIAEEPPDDRKGADREPESDDSRGKAGSVGEFIGDNCNRGERRLIGAINWVQYNGDAPTSGE
jgi:hypothetical protein